MVATYTLCSNRTLTDWRWQRGERRLRSRADITSDSFRINTQGGSIPFTFPCIRKRKTLISSPSADASRSLSFSHARLPKAHESLFTFSRNPSFTCPGSRTHFCCSNERCEFPARRWRFWWDSEWELLRRILAWQRGVRVQSPYQDSLQSVHQRKLAAP